MANENDAATCGKGLAANSRLPAKLGESVSGLADVLAHHMTALDQSEAAGKQEYGAYESLVGQFRDISARLAKAANEMKCYHDLPMAEHDMSVMTSRKSLEVFGNFVQKKQELREMFQQTSEEDEKMLAQMQG